MSKFWIILITLFGTALLLFLLWRSPPNELTDLLSNNTTSIPTYPITFVINSNTKQYDKTGKLSYSIRSASTHYFDNNSSGSDVVFENPEIIVYDNSETLKKQTSTLRVSADRGVGNEKQDQLILEGNVILEQTADSGSISTLTTEQLQVQPNRRYAETTKPVIITDKTGVTSAIGLKVFFDDKRIELLSDVKGKYAPQ